jgi:hypothetical protein
MLYVLKISPDLPHSLDFSLAKEVNGGGIGRIAYNVMPLGYVAD